MLPAFPPSRSKRIALLYGLPFLLIAGTLAAAHRAWIEGMFMDGLCYAALGRNAAEHGHWLVPHLSSEMFDRFFEHPPLFFMYEGTVFSVFGASWVTARLLMLPFSLGALALLWTALRKEAGRRTAFLAAALLLTCYPWMRWARFPNLDLPVALFGGLALLAARRGLLQGRLCPWLWAGLWFGLALLMKGWFAGFVPLAILFFAVGSGTARELKSVRPWIGLALGLGLFLLWPLALWSQGDLAGFKAYLTSGLAKPGVDAAPFSGLLKMLVRTAGHTALALVGIRHLRRNASRTHVGWMFVAWCLAVLIPLQFAGAGHAHWYLALYPAQAALAGIGLVSLGRTWSRRAVHAVWVAVPAVAIALAVLPLGTTPHRDRSIYATMALTRDLRVAPDQVAAVNACVPTWRFISAGVFLEAPPARPLTLDDARGELAAPAVSTRQVVLWSRADLDALSAALRATFNQRYAVVRRFDRDGVVAAVDRRLLPAGGWFAR